MSEATSIDLNRDAARRSNTEKTLIVLSAPSVHERCYSSRFNEIIDYMINFTNIVNGKDEVVILADADTLSYFKGKVPPNTLMEANMQDIWIRDFSTVITGRQVKFKYRPYHDSSSSSKAIEKKFQKWFSRNGLHHSRTSNIILDGGNVVDNPAGTSAIVTDRILRDNPLSKASAKESLKQLLGVNEVAIIKESPEDTTGHSDGMLMWATNNRLLVMKPVESIRAKVLNEFKSSFPNVEIIEVPSYYRDETWRHFDSARNVYVNSIVTDHYIYMPTFNSRHDTEMLRIFQSLTNKTVVPVPAEKVCMMGGSVRCLSWQIKGPNKMKILQRVLQ